MNTRSFSILIFLLAILATASALLYQQAINLPSAFAALLFAYVAMPFAEHFKWLTGRPLFILRLGLCATLFALPLYAALPFLSREIPAPLAFFIIAVFSILITFYSCFISLANSAELEKCYINENKQLRTFFSDCIIAVLVPVILIVGDFNIFGKIDAHTVIFGALLFIKVFAPRGATLLYVRWCQKKAQETRDAPPLWNILYHFAQTAPIIAMVEIFCLKVYNAP